MKRSVIGTVSAFVLAGTAMSALGSVAQAQIRMNFSAPFVSDSGLVGASLNEHFFTVAVTGFPLETLFVELPDEMQTLGGATVTDSSGQEIESNVQISEGQLTIAFPQPIELDTYVTVNLNGVEMNRYGENVIYRVYAEKQGLTGPLPIGAAMVRVPDRTS